MLAYVFSQKGQKRLIDDGYLFKKDTDGANGKTIWKYSILNVLVLNVKEDADTERQSDVEVEQSHPSKAYQHGKENRF